MKYLIRKAFVDEVIELKEITQRVINTNYRLFLGDEAVKWLIESGILDQYISSNISNCSVLLTDNKIVGLCLCKSNLIDLMIVDDKYHHNGYGSRLLEYCEDCLFDKFDELELETLNGNESANNFYLKRGWMKKEQDSHAYPGVTKLVFVKRKEQLSVY